MNIHYSEEFRKHFYKLPKNAQRAYRTQEERFRKNWKDARLHVKKLSGRNIVFSFRVTRNYRVLFMIVEDNTIIFSAIGNRKDIYRKS